MKNSNRRISKLAIVSIGALPLFYSTLASATFAPQPVPEPGPMGLLILGGVALLLARRIRRNK